MLFDFAYAKWTADFFVEFFCSQNIESKSSKKKSHKKSDTSTKNANRHVRNVSWRIGGL